MQDKLAASNQRATELELQLAQQHQQALKAEEHGKTLERQLEEEQQSSARLARKRDDSEAELAAQVSVFCHTICSAHDDSHAVDKCCCT